MGADDRTEVLTIRYEHLAEREAALLYALDSLVGVIERVSLRGGFVGSLPDGRPSLIQLRTAAMRWEGGVQQQLRCGNLDPRILCCLSQMIVRLFKDRVPLDRISMVDLGRTGSVRIPLQWPNEDNEPSAYPAGHRDLNVLMKTADLDFSKSRRFLVSIDRSLLPSEVGEFEAWIHPWAELLESSAFALPVALPQEAESMVGIVSQFDDRTVEVGVNRFIASEQAWQVLGNMTLVHWRARSNVQSIEIE